MKRISITVTESVKVAHVDGNVIGFLPLTARVYGVADLDGKGMLYAETGLGEWFMITPKSIRPYPAAERFVLGAGGLSYAMIA